MAADLVIYCLENLTDYDQFERLCHDLMAAEGYAGIEPLGGMKDKGRDAIHVDRCNGEVTVFAYSVREDWRAKLKEDSESIHKHGHTCDKLAFLCTATFTGTERDEAIAFVHDTFGWNLDLYGLARLRILLTVNHERLIANHPQIFTPSFFVQSRELPVAGVTTNEHRRSSPAGPVRSSQPKGIPTIVQGEGPFPWGIKPNYDADSGRLYLTGQQIQGLKIKQPEVVFVPSAGPAEVKLDKWYKLEKVPNKDAYYLDALTTVESKTKLELLSQLQSEHGLRRRGARQAIDELLARGIRLCGEWKAQLLLQVLNDDSEDQERAGCMTLLHTDHSWDLESQLLDLWMDPARRVLKTLSSRLVTYASDSRNPQGFQHLLATLGDSADIPSLDPDRLADVLHVLNVRLDGNPALSDSDLTAVGVQARQYKNHGNQTVRNISGQILEKLK